MGGSKDAGSSDRETRAASCARSLSISALDRHSIKLKALRRRERRSFSTWRSSALHRRVVDLAEADACGRDRDCRARHLRSATRSALVISQGPTGVGKTEAHQGALHAAFPCSWKRRGGALAPSAAPSEPHMENLRSSSRRAARRYVGWRGRASPRAWPTRWCCSTKSREARRLATYWASQSVGGQHQERRGSAGLVVAARTVGCRFDRHDAFSTLAMPRRCVIRSGHSGHSAHRRRRVPSVEWSGPSCSSGNRRGRGQMSSADANPRTGKGLDRGAK